MSQAEAIAQAAFAYEQKRRDYDAASADYRFV